jgi:hypothetical protein
MKEISVKEKERSHVVIIYRTISLLADSEEGKISFTAPPFYHPDYSDLSSRIL